MICRICNNAFGNELITLNEQMFGTGEKFHYQICGNCNSMQIAIIPQNLNSYYPDTYYSLSEYKNPSFKQYFKRKIFNVFSYLKGDYFKNPSFLEYGITYNERQKQILDIGCGNGKLLWEMKELGFRNLTGIDPHLKKVHKSRVLKLLNCDIEQVTGSFDIIMSHHSLEHLTDPHVFFRCVSKILRANGRIIVRIPIYPNYIWNMYSIKWIQLDPPRHIFTFTIKAIEYLCALYNLEVSRINYDSQPWSLAGTEFCLKGKPYIEFEKNVQITQEQVDRCRQANDAKNGDSVCIEITKAL